MGFIDVIDRLLDDWEADWREGFAALSEGEADELSERTVESRRVTGAGLADRQATAIDRVVDRGRSEQGDDGDDDGN